jgi:hypothetical protein
VLDAVARNRGIIVVPAWWQALRLLNVLFPSLSEALGRRELRRMAPLLHRPTPGD